MRKAPTQVERQSQSQVDHKQQVYWWRHEIGGGERSARRQEDGRQRMESKEGGCHQHQRAAHNQN